MFVIVSAYLIFAKDDRYQELECWGEYRVRWRQNEGSVFRVGEDVHAVRVRRGKNFIYVIF
jgi:hypothetical protein